MESSVSSHPNRQRLPHYTAVSVSSSPHRAHHLMFRDTRLKTPHLISLFVHRCLPTTSSSSLSAKIASFAATLHSVSLSSIPPLQPSHHAP